MVQAPATKLKLIVEDFPALTFEEFLQWDDGTDRLFELDHGIPVPITDPNATHENVGDGLWQVLNDHCKVEKLSYVPKRGKQVKLKTEPGEKEKSRRADIIIFAKDEWQKLENSPSSAIAYTPPPMVIEVTSTNWKDDYLTKLGQYEDLGIQEYWIVDYKAFGGTRYIGMPKQPTIFVYQFDLNRKEYQIPQEFREDQLIKSNIFPKIKLTAKQVFQLARW
ncbi:MAG: Uma2 family endonuclease [Cyanothece sp. SIO1E1]|nr:Uma2 family endonuclease [Cyanothece sp. SIO1E1]